MWKRVSIVDLVPSMDNSSTNISVSGSDNTAAIIGTTVADGVLLLAVFFTMVLNLLVIAALIGKDNSELVLSIRVILINILAASVIGALGSALYHIYSPIARLVSSASTHQPPLCLTSLFLSSTSSSGRILFTAFYGVAVFIVVRCWSRPVLAPRNTNYFILASAVLWLLAVATAGINALFIVYQSLSGICSNRIQESQNTSYSISLAIASPYLAVSCIPIIITPIILIETSCYVKRKTITEHKETKKALVNFGLFLIIVQAFNAFAHICIPLLGIIGIHILQRNSSLVFTVAVALSDLSRIPTSTLILIFFKPVRLKVRRWICRCFLDCHAFKQEQTGTNIISVQL